MTLTMTTGSQRSIDHAAGSGTPRSNTFHMTAVEVTAFCVTTYTAITPNVKPNHLTLTPILTISWPRANQGYPASGVFFTLHCL